MPTEDKTEQMEPANAEQIRYWNEAAGPTWVKYQDSLDLQLAELGKHAMDRGRIGDGQRVLDIGCGCGDTTLDIAGRVGSAGSVTGIDVSALMLERGRATAATTGLDNVRFDEADAQTSAFSPAAFDVLYSRFGVMFFEDPDAAFANLRGSLVDGGRLSFVCWQKREENPWMTLPVMAAMRHVTIDMPASPHAPGPFAFGDSERVRGILERAGFTDTEFEDHRRTVVMGGGGTLEEAVDFASRVGPVARVLNSHPPEVREAVMADLCEVFAPYYRGDGLYVESATWMVTGRAA